MPPKPNAIIIINKEAKRLRESHPSWEWKNCIKEASKRYRENKL